MSFGFIIFGQGHQRPLVDDEGINIEANEGERWNKCPVCDKTFSRKNYVKLHVKTVHEGQKTHRCEVCDNSFTAKDDHPIDIQL